MSKLDQIVSIFSNESKGAMPRLFKTELRQRRKLELNNKSIQQVVADKNLSSPAISNWRCIDSKKSSGFIKN
jgi:hypothetical protein